MLGRVATLAAWSRPFAWFVELLEHLDREPPGLLRVLTYHRVQGRDVSAPSSPGVTITPEVFADQMRYLREHFHVVPMREVIEAVQGRVSLPRRSVLITFDDGYRDFREQAWPVLKALELPVTLFVPTAFPSEPGRVFWWDRLYHALMNTARGAAPETPVGRLALNTPRQREDAYIRLRSHVKQMPHAEALASVEAICLRLAVAPPPPAVLSWDELRELSTDGVSLGSHTRTHPLLTQVPPEEVRAEVSGSLADLKREVGVALPILAYPAGAFDERVVRLLAEEGYVLAFTTVRGINQLHRAHPLKLRRIHVGQRTSLALMRVQVLARSVGLNRFYPVGSRAHAASPIADPRVQRP